MIAIDEAKATLADLHREPGKAELIGGKIRRFMSTGLWPGIIAGKIFELLLLYARATGRGIALGDNVGFAVPELASGRESFSPDASLYIGPKQDDDTDFVQGPPTFAVEVRSKGDFGPAAELEMVAKRADYFEAGTRVVWDVDYKAKCINAYTSERTKRTFQCGEVADAEPALPGWRVSVDKIFEK